MKKLNKLLPTPAFLLATQVQAAVDVSGFTVEGASRPYGLILVCLLLVAVGLASLRSSS